MLHKEKKLVQDENKKIHLFKDFYLTENLIYILCWIYL